MSGPVCVLGDGQLGRMLRQAGEPLGIKVYPVGIETNGNTLPFLENCIVTSEIERWPATPLTQKLEQTQGFVNRSIFPIIADRQRQKKLLDTLGLPTAPWQSLLRKADFSRIFEQLGPTVIVKRRTGGYDGRGQYRITPATLGSLPEDVYQNAIVESCVPFAHEVSLIGARNRQGDCIFYPLTYNYHEEGILKLSMAEGHYSNPHQSQAEKMLTQLMKHTDYVGVMAMECFIVNERLLINELAPRVHNSGHWTQNGASVSQFELHLRAILDLPFICPKIDSISLMINLLGIACDYTWLSLPNVHLHWYDKTLRENRKMGHLNITPGNKEELVTVLTQFKPFLPASYYNALHWAEMRLLAS